MCFMHASYHLIRKLMNIINCGLVASCLILLSLENGLVAGRGQKWHCNPTQPDLKTLFFILWKRKPILWCHPCLIPRRKQRDWRSKSCFRSNFNAFSGYVRIGTRKIFWSFLDQRNVLGTNLGNWSLVSTSIEVSTLGGKVRVRP